MVTFSLTLTSWPESASELYRPSDRLLSAKLVPTFAYRGCYVASVTDPYFIKTKRDRQTDRQTERVSDTLAGHVFPTHVSVS
jgi:hypothetical protein